MTADKIQSIACALGNSSWTRYWLTRVGKDGRIRVGIQCRDISGNPEPILNPEGIGLANEGNFLYTALRTNEDGTRYESKLL